MMERRKSMENPHSWTTSDSAYGTLQLKQEG